MFYLAIIFVLFVVLVWKSLSKSKDVLQPDKKVLLITGCDSGIGLGTAIHLHKLGFHVFAGCHLLDSDGALKIKNINSESLIPVQMDITKQNEVDDVVEKVKEYCKTNSCKFWSLINNAGVCIVGKIEWQTWEQINKQVDVNLFGTIRTIRACLPLLKQSKGRIVNVGSISARWPYPNFSAYVASKCAAEGLSHVLRVDMAPYGIKVIVVAPGNHCRITKLFQHQLEYAKQQWESLTPEMRKELGDSFWNVHSNVVELSRISCPDSFENADIIRDMLSAVTAVDPNPYYLSSTLSLKLGLYFYELLPTQFKDYLMSTFDSYSLRSQSEIPFFLKP